MTTEKIPYMMFLKSINDVPSIKKIRELHSTYPLVSIDKAGVNGGVKITNRFSLFAEGIYDIMNNIMYNKQAITPADPYDSIWSDIPGLISTGVEISEPALIIYGALGYDFNIDRMADFVPVFLKDVKSVNRETAFEIIPTFTDTTTTSADKRFNVLFPKLFTELTPDYLSPTLVDKVGVNVVNVATINGVAFYIDETETTPVLIPMTLVHMFSQPMTDNGAVLLAFKELALVSETTFVTAPTGISLLKVSAGRTSVDGKNTMAD